MPDPVPVAPASGVPPPVQPPPAPPPTPTPPADGKPQPHPLRDKLFNLLTAPAIDETKPKEKTPEAAPIPPKPETKPPTEEPIKRREKAKADDKPPVIPKKSDLAPKPTDTPPPPAQTAADFEKELIDEERALLEDARAAEKYLGDKYKGQSAKMTAFLRENAKKAEAVDKGELEQAEYETWHAANLPKISVLDQRQIQRLAVKEDVTREFEPKIAEERHARWIESETPKIKAKGNEVYGKLINSALPDEVMTAIAERTKGVTDRAEYIKRVNEVQKDYALECEIAENVIGIATGDIEEFHRITTVNPATNKPLATFEANNPQHERLVKMVTEICDEFKASGGADLKKDGKWFVTREEWQGMAPEQRAPFWTFNNDQLIDRALGKVKAAVTNVVAAKRKELEERYGFKRTIPAPAAPPPPQERMPGFGAPPTPRDSAVSPGGTTAQPSLGATLAGKLTSQPTSI